MNNQFIYFVFFYLKRMRPDVCGDCVFRFKIVTQSP